MEVSIKLLDSSLGEYTSQLSLSRLEKVLEF